MYTHSPDIATIMVINLMNVDAIVIKLRVFGC